ncbi:MAG: MerR family transcriptional regulator [Clostridia bacterium]|nr:MerR family transcriptional regulator [Clostridia bacterium]
MSLYTTGELAKLCGVSVRTVQYYDTRGLLMPTELSEGGRRLYSEEDLSKMKVICYLKELGLSLSQIATLLKEEESDAVIATILEEQLFLLKEELADKQKKIDRIKKLQQALKKTENSLREAVGDVALIMEYKKKRRKVILTMILSAIPVGILQWGSIILWIMTGIWWPFLVWLAVGIPYAVLISRYYFKNVAYICPKCHHVFLPKFGEAFWANHTPNTRKLTCPKCNHRGFCVETHRSAVEETEETE